MKNSAISEPAAKRIFCPSVSFTKRASGSTGNIILSRVLAVLATVCISLLIICLTVDNPNKIGDAMERVFLSRFISKSWTNMIVGAIPLIIVSVGICIAFKMKLWNIGGNGQIMFGALCAYSVTMFAPGLPGWAMIPLMMLASMAGGALWAGICAVPKAYLNVNETITSLMLNYIAVLLVKYMIRGPWRDPNGGNTLKAALIPESARLTQFGSSGISTAAIIALVVVIVYFILINKTKWGYEVRVTGNNPEAARYAGMSVKRNMVMALMLSGAVAGLAGYSLLAGGISNTSISENLAGNLGFTAVIIAWISRLNPIAVIFMSMLFVGIEGGAKAAGGFGLNEKLGELIQGIFLFSVIILDFITRYEIKLSFFKTKTAEANDVKPVSKEEGGQI